MTADRMPSDRLSAIVDPIAARLRGNGFDRCLQRSTMLIKALERDRRGAILLRCRGYLGDVEAADRRWRRLPAESWIHYVVLDVEDGLVIDLSATQINGLSTCPEYASEAALSLRWSEVGPAA